MTDILDLKGWVVLSKSQSDGEYVIEAEYTVQPTNCPKNSTYTRSSSGFFISETP